MASAADLRSSRLPSGEPDGWEQSAALREAVRIYLPPHISEMVSRGVAGEFYVWLERWPGPPTGTSCVELYLEAVKVDLRYSARFLALAARETLIEGESSAAAEKLGWFADGLALRVEELADFIAARLGRAERAVRTGSSA